MHGKLFEQHDVILRRSCGTYLPRGIAPSKDALWASVLDSIQFAVPASSLSWAAHPLGTMVPRANAPWLWASMIRRVLL